MKVNVEIELKTQPTVDSLISELEKLKSDSGLPGDATVGELYPRWDWKTDTEYWVLVATGEQSDGLKDFIQSVFN